jgi:hypothetical protein
VRRGLIRRARATGSLIDCEKQSTYDHCRFHAFGEAIVPWLSPLRSASEAAPRESVVARDTISVIIFGRLILTHLDVMRSPAPLNNRRPSVRGNQHRRRHIHRVIVIFMA